MSYMMNIGMAREGKPDLTEKEVILALFANNVNPSDYALHQSDTERTFVVACWGNVMSDFDDICRMSVGLQQQCIATYDFAVRTGQLIGPDSAAWGKFNPEFFLHMNGEKLSKVLSL